MALPTTTAAGHFELAEEALRTAQRHARLAMDAARAMGQPRPTKATWTAEERAAAKALNAAVRLSRAAGDGIGIAKEGRTATEQHAGAAARAA